MSFKDLELPITISTSLGEDPYKEAIIPLLKKSKFYDRGVAYFYSEWIELAGEGLVTFIENGGKIRLITSININKDEYDAFILGNNAKTDEILKREIFDVLTNSKIGKTSWTLPYLSWLIASDLLEVRVSVNMLNNINIYHDKVSFLDDGSDVVCIHGSLNDSYNATKNQESINLFCSWDKRDNERIKIHKKSFENTWNNSVDNYITVKLPEFLKLEFENIKSDFNPFKKLEISDPISITKKYIRRPYQEDAIQSLVKNKYNGVLSMATGTGKTLTSLFFVQEYIKKFGESVVCIVVPQLHLLYQWVDIVKDVFRNINILICAENKTNWASKLFNFLDNNDDKTTFLFTTYKTINDDLLKKKLFNYNEKKLLYIFDECHKLGTKELIREFIPNPNSNRIGLSATPNRWLDLEGNKFIDETIGPVVYDFGLEKAIKENFLCEYEYYPHLSELNHIEFEKFVKFSDEIGKLSSMIDEDSDKKLEEKLKILLNQRADVTKKCFNKFNDFHRVFSRSEDKKYSIVYVYDKQVDRMISEIKEKYNLNVHGITAFTPILQRKQILDSFNNGNIDVIVAIQCLDEGVDIPNCRNAYVLASSTNPREFIQRRGRVLRKSKSKEFGTIHDFITIAPTAINFYDDYELTEVVKRELSRVSEFIRLSRNKEDNELIKYLFKIKALNLYEDYNPWNLKDIHIQIEEEENE